MANDVDIHGLEDAVKRMRGLGPKMRKKLLRQGLTRGAAVVRKAARNNAKRIDDPDTAERIDKNIVTRAMPKRDRQRQYPDADAGVAVVVRGGRQAPGGNTYYWWFIELGTAQMAAVPFMRPAMAESIQPATDAVAQRINQGIDKLL